MSKDTAEKRLTEYPDVAADIIEKNYINVFIPIFV